MNSLTFLLVDPYQAEETSGTPLDMSYIDTIPHTYRLLASGGIAGCVAKTATAPLSRLTILFQVRLKYTEQADRLLLWVMHMVIVLDERYQCRGAIGRMIMMMMQTRLGFGLLLLSCYHVCLAKDVDGLQWLSVCKCGGATKYPQTQLS